MCDCGDFPVYSTKLGHLAFGCKLTAVDHLCLFCIRDALTYGYGTEPELDSVFWSADLQREYQMYYQSFYTRQEAEAQEAAESDEHWLARMEQTMQRLVPWLQKRGVRRTCPHTGTPTPCRAERCLRGTEPIPAANC
jgi:hypothetical protein